VRLVLVAERLPLLPGARAFAAAGHLTGGCKRNRDWLADKVEVAPTVPADLAEVAWDPQTSGGLLASVPAAIAPRLVDALTAAGGRGPAGGPPAPPPPHPGPVVALPQPRAASISSRLRGQSSFRRRESERSASRTPPVWQRAQ